MFILIQVLPSAYSHTCRKSHVLLIFLSQTVVITHLNLLADILEVLLQ